MSIELRRITVDLPLELVTRINVLAARRDTLKRLIYTEILTLGLDEIDRKEREEK